VAETEALAVTELVLAAVALIEVVDSEEAEFATEVVLTEGVTDAETLALVLAAPATEVDALTPEADSDVLTVTDGVPAGDGGASEEIAVRVSAAAPHPTWEHSASSIASRRIESQQPRHSQGSGTVVTISFGMKPRYFLADRLSIQVVLLSPASQDYSRNSISAHSESPKPYGNNRVLASCIAHGWRSMVWGL